MATPKRASAITGKKVKKFNTLQELMAWLNSGNKVVSLATTSGVTIGAQVGLSPNFQCYMSGANIYVSILNTTGSVNAFNWNLTHVGYLSASTLEEIGEELKEAKEAVKLLETKIAFMKETGAEEFDENEFKVYNTLTILDEKKLSKLDKAKAICDRLKAKGFASTNVVLGIGSYTYQYNTRDTFGFAMKATYGEITSNKMDARGFVETREIFKDPITDDGTKRSKKGLLGVFEDANYTGVIFCQDQLTKEQEQRGLLETVFKDGKLVKTTTLAEIRERLNKQ